MPAPVVFARPPFECIATLAETPGYNDPGPEGGFTLETAAGHMADQVGLRLGSPPR